jgi:transcriptional regulator with XRE-family HTH domain
MYRFNTLFELRGELGLTQRAMADKLGISDRSYHPIELSRIEDLPIKVQQLLHLASLDLAVEFEDNSLAHPHIANLARRFVAKEEPRKNGNPAKKGRR